MSWINNHRRRRSGFTLIELMLTVGIIALLSAIAIPGYLEARNSGLRSSYMTELRKTWDAFTQFANERRNLPPTSVSAVPDNMDTYLPKNSSWGNGTGPDIGGNWSWLNMDTFSGGQLGSWGQFRGWIITSNMPIRSTDVAKLDQNMDDGNAGSGALRYEDTGNGTYRVFYGVN